MTLAEGTLQKEYIVEKMDLSPEIFMRLQSLGMLHGTKVKILNRKRKGSIIFKMRGTRLAVGKEIAQKIYVSDENEGTK